MARPTILMAEPDPIQALSVRKLVLETAKFNVMTAHSPEETLELVELFPNISALVVAYDQAFNCDAIVKTIRRTLKKLPVIVVTAHVGQRCDGANHHVSSHEPERLLELARALLGDPRLNKRDVKTDGSRPRPKNPKREREPGR